MITIRPYQEKDRDNVRIVCMQTANFPNDTQPGPQHTKLLTTYCDYYIERQPQHCFVAANEHDEAVGYILCAPDYWAYREEYLRDYAPRSKGLPFVQRFECVAAAKMPRLFWRNYPAHLHIDILDAYQRMGVGHRLMDALTAHLRELGVPAVMLGVSPTNKKGCSFYKKYGFHKVRRLPFTLVLGLKMQ